jgi:hypothetical protein
MPEQGPPVERVATPIAASRRTWEKDGKEKSAWTITFEGGAKADTFSAECARVCEDNLNKPLKVTVVNTGRKFQDKDIFDITRIMSADGAAELYSGGQTKRGGQRGNYNQRPDWSYEDKDEREERARSIEAQVAAKSATWVFGYLVQFGDHEDVETKKLLTSKGALEFIERCAGDISKGIRKRAAVRSSKLGSGVAERPSPSPGSRPQGLEPSPTAGDGEVASRATPSFAEGSSQGEGTLAPEPDSSADELREARNLALELFKTPKSVEKAYAISHGGEVVKFTDLTAEQLANLAANPPETESEPAGAASGTW